MAASAPPIAPEPHRTRRRTRLTQAAPLRRAWRRVRPVLFWSHLAVGVAAGAVILVMSITGVLLAYQRQLTEWSAGAGAAAPPFPGAPRLPLDTLLARAAAAAPGGDGPAALTVRADPASAVAVSVGRRRTVWVNPYTGAVAEASPRLVALFHEAERWHRSLATGESLRDAVGVTVTGACNLAFLFLVLSGMCLWWPRRWTPRAFRAVLLFQRRATGRQRDWNWHHVLGVWSAPALGAIAFSAVFMSYQWPQRVVQRLARVRAEAARGGGAARGDRDTGPRAGLDALVARAAAEVPGWYSIQLRLPRPGQARVTATVATTSALRPDRRATLTLDARTGAVRERQGYADLDAARRFRSWMRGLHTGEVAGAPGQGLAALFSAAAAALACTGLALTWRRLRGRLAR